jgi:exopolysaccharide biosynthesis polyprenyl glycosylphosphotransferase
MITSSNGLRGTVVDPEGRSGLADFASASTVDAVERADLSSLRRSVIRQVSKAIGAFEVGADFFGAALAVFLAYSLYCGLHMGRLARYSNSKVAVAVALVGLFYVLMLKANGAYTRAMSLLRVRETERVIAASSELCLLVFAVSFWTDITISRYVVLFSAIAIPLIVLTEKQIIGKLVRWLHVHGYSARRTVIYGAGISGNRALSVLARSPKLGLDPVAIVDDDLNEIGKQVRESAYSPARSMEVLAGPLTAERLRQWSVEAVIISSPSISAEKFEEISVQTARAGATLSFVPHDTVTSNRSLSYWDADGLIFASVDERRAGNIYEYLKRTFDFAVALLLLLILSPGFLLIACLISLTSQGPAFFVQDRVGKNGRLFRMYKFRTMRADSPQYAHSPTCTRDPRITRIGAFLRRTSFDELPQLINVLEGHMSLVGPRPEMPFIVELYSELQRQRLWVKPGITGLWQISADRAHLIHENIQYDLYYIRHCTFFMDLAILLHTFAFAMRGI